MSGYSRDQFGPAWTDDNSNFSGLDGCDERNNALQRELTAIVNFTQNWSGTTYTVEFAPEPGATVTVIGLTEGDIQPS